MVEFPSRDRALLAQVLHVVCADTSSWRPPASTCAWP